MGYFLRSGVAVKPEELRDIKSVDRASARVWEPCGRCGGTGYVWATHVEGGRCFACRTARGFFKIKPCYSAEKLAKLEAAAEKRAAKKAAKVEAIRAKNLADTIALVGEEVWAEVHAWTVALTDDDVFNLNKWDRALLDMHDKADDAINGGLSEKAADYFNKLWANKKRFAAEKAEADANAVDVEEGRYEVTGTIITTKHGYNDFGDTYKMLVDCGDYRVFGSIPAPVRREHNWEDLKGRTITFTGTFKAKEKGFGFFSRPSKAAIKEEA